MHSAVLALLLTAAGVLGLASNASAVRHDDELAKVKAELEKTQSELGATRAQLDATREALEKLADKVDRIESGAGATASTAPSGPRIAPVNADNPAISLWTRPPRTFWANVTPPRRTRPLPRDVIHHRSGF